ncbi:MAG: hypothetical protein AAFV07_14760, partial [Bacteroidota bacterium]
MCTSPKPLIFLLFSCVCLVNSAAQSLTQDLRGFNPPTSLSFQIDHSRPSLSERVSLDMGELRNASMWEAGDAWEFNSLSGETIRPEGWAGLVWADTAYWASQWFSDTLIQLSETGEVLDAFTIPGISQVRGMTFDGQYIWTANTSGTLRAFDPNTRMIVSALTIPGGRKARYIAYDAVADGGNGGFYAGDFGTDITLISKGGSILSTLPLSIHQRMGIYGLVVDRTNPDDPYLWAFDQAEWPSFATIVQLDANTGAYTGLQFDVATNVASPFANAGGLTLKETRGEHWLATILQDDISRLLTYRLDY